ncbi:MAG: hypothetical protein VKP63_02240 [Cyanobacteriota bacterium]|nr:hypothetical protein [Cyanobacteriota bacterium]
MRPPRPTRGLPTSRAYWELKAEQMMNRVFAPDAAIDLEPLAPEPEAPRAATSPHRPLPPATPATAPQAAPRAAVPPAGGPTASGGTPKRNLSELTVVLGAMLAGVGLVGALGAVILVQQWAGLQRTLSQERNLLLVERLRALGPATAPAAPETLATPPAPVLDPTPATAGAAPLPANAPAPAPGQAQSREVASFDGLPPPPPDEPWMAQLASLPPTGGRAPLRVPVSPRLTAAAPAAVASPPPARPAARPQGAAGRANGASRPRSTAPLPQLVGLVGAPGRAGSAIFQVGTTAMNVNVGEQIGSSGWLLRAADGESAVIERGTEVRRIAIVAGG